MSWSRKKQKGENEMGALKEKEWLEEIKKDPSYLTSGIGV